MFLSLLKFYFTVKLEETYVTAENIKECIQNQFIQADLDVK